MEKLNKILKNSEKAITLISLVVTIIVLLILAGISISMLSGNNGILQRTTYANEKTGEAQIKEKIGLAWNGIQTEGIVNGWTLDQKAGALQTELKKEDGSTIATASGKNVEVKNYKGYNAVINSTNGSFISFIKSTDENEKNTLKLIANDKSTESRVAIIEVTQNVTVPTKTELQNLETNDSKKVQAMFLDFLQSGLNLPVESWDDFTGEDNDITVEQAFKKLPPYMVSNYEDGYDAIIKTSSYLDKLTFICNGENVTGKQAEFIVKRNGSYTVTATNSNGETGTVKANVTKCKIEEYSNIQSNNYKLEKDGYEVWIPKGFAYGTSANVGTVTKGIVITDNIEVVDEKNYSIGNEFVWIPVDKDNLTVGKTNKKIAELLSGTNYRGVLYDWDSESTGNITIANNSKGLREPDVVYYIDTELKPEQGITSTTMQSEYNSMIKSIKQYGGFYIARYEMGKENGDFSKLAVIPDSSENKNWYELNLKAKSYSNSIVTSEMIWASQYDAILNFGLTNPTDSGKISSNTNGNHMRDLLKTGTYTGIDSINNVFDLEGNLSEWTKGAMDEYNRIIMGGARAGFIYAPIYRAGNQPHVGAGNTTGTRMTLYLN